MKALPWVLYCFFLAGSVFWGVKAGPGFSLSFSLFDWRFAATGGEAAFVVGVCAGLVYFALRAMEGFFASLGVMRASLLRQQNRRRFAKALRFALSGRPDAGRALLRKVSPKDLFPDLDPLWQAFLAQGEDRFSLVQKLETGLSFGREEVLAFFALWCRRDKDNDLAARLAEDVVAKRPSLFSLREMLAEIGLEKEKPFFALEEGRRLLKFPEEREFLENLLRRTFSGIAQASEKKAPEEAEKSLLFWEKPLMRDFPPRLWVAYAEALLGQGLDSRAFSFLLRAYEKTWDPQVLKAWMACPGALAVKIKKAEKWLVRRPRDAELLKTLGQACARAGIFGKARMYLRACYDLTADPEAGASLAALPQDPRQEVM